MTGVAEVGLGHLRSLSWVVVAEAGGCSPFREVQQKAYKKFSVVM